MKTLVICCIFLIATVNLIQTAPVGKLKIEEESFQYIRNAQEKIFVFLLEVKCCNLIQVCNQYLHICYMTEMASSNKTAYQT